MGLPLTVAAAVPAMATAAEAAAALSKVMKPEPLKAPSPSAPRTELPFFGRRVHVATRREGAADVVIGDGVGQVSQVHPGPRAHSGVRLGR
mmetsp:Transcript_53380/g.114024  ORF Transcript_53380/g.114024 Transcript_53380/m.114024 type:complete len:91 (+) Transcript_53380:340-612(+)